MAVAVSKKHGKAVKRNRIKRLAKAAFHDSCDMLDKPYSVIIIPKICEDYSYEGYKKSLVSCFKRINSCGKG